MTGSRKPALFVPSGLRSHEANPLVVSLARRRRGRGRHPALMQAEAERRKFLLLAPQSQGPTWDVIMAPSARTSPRWTALWSRSSVRTG
jgi:poly(3-hydroxybutyrate) depolymerase